MVPVEAMVYVLGGVPINVVEYKISIVLSRSCKNDYFVKLTHVFEKLDATWSQLELFLSSNEMDQCLVKIQDKCIWLVVGLLWQEVLRFLEVYDVLTFQVVFVFGLSQNLFGPLLRSLKNS